MKLFKNKQSKDISVIQGGYSDVRLWPCYMIYSSLILFFAPQIGVMLSIVIFTVIGATVAVYAGKRIPKEVFTYDSDTWFKDFTIAFDNNEELPDLDNYRLASPAKVKEAKPKKITTKRRALWPYLDMPSKFRRTNLKAIT